MNPFSIYHLCREGFPRFQQQLTDVITKTTTPDMIFLLGATLHRKRSESILNESAPYSQQLSDCTLLILLPNLANKELYEWQDKIENDCGSLMPVTTLVLATSTFVEWLQAGLPLILLSDEYRRK